MSALSAICLLLIGAVFGAVVMFTVLAVWAYGPHSDKRPEDKE